MARDPTEEEMPTTLRRLYLRLRRNGTQIDRAITLSELWNSATNPAILRLDSEHKQCNRVARACKATIRRYGLPVRELSNGTLLAISPW